MEGRWDEEIHAVSYLMYAYLQGAQDAKAKEILDDFASIENVTPQGLKVAYPLASVPARYALEMNRGWFRAKGVMKGDRMRKFPQVDVR